MEMDETNEYILILQALSFISVISSLLVILNLYLVRRRARAAGQFDFAQIYEATAYVAVGNVIGNAGYLSRQRPNTGSIGCAIDGFFQIFGYPASWLWTLQLSFIIYCLAVWEEVPASRWRAYAGCWLLPFILAFAQFGMGGYGEHTKGENRYDICANRQSNPRSMEYHYISFYGLLLLVVVVMVAMRVKLFYLSWKKDARMDSPLIQVVQRSLEFYPALLLICWIPHTIIYFIPHVSQPVKLFGLCLKIAHGFLLSIAYFYQSSPGRRMMHLMLRPTFWLGNDIISGGSVHLSNLSIWSWNSGRSTEPGAASTTVNDMHRIRRNDTNNTGRASEMSGLPSPSIAASSLQSMSLQSSPSTVSSSSRKYKSDLSQSSHKTTSTSTTVDRMIK